ncbi:MAG: ABC transporter permease, partial [Deltaproteobacteria bacterium]|nr:ABC transporter permease [Deltaproteobacteria bacterium]
MSIQTGVERQEESAARGLRGRLGGLVRRLRDDPNPLWIREMRQASRFQATPFALAGFTLIATLLVGMLAGLQTASSRAPATVGATLFHAFFSLAYFVVVLIGPALGANSIASERDGRTWEALLLTGLRPEVITRGKFLGAFTSIAMYVVALAPVSALPFIFGGVTPFEVLIAFVFLVLLALLAVAFGLATSARMESQRGAVVITLLAAVPIGGVLFSMFGLGGSSFAHSLWNGVRRGAPIWLPSAYGVAPFGLEFVLFLVLLPAACLGLPTWLLYEVTLANLTSVTEDRSFGLKRWHLVTSVALLALGCTLGAWHEADYPAERFGNLSLLLLVHALVATIMFSNETLGPSRRVERMLAGAGRLRRWLAPGVVPTVRLLRLTLSFTTVLVTA